MAGAGDPTKIPVDYPRYGTFPQPPPLTPPPSQSPASVPLPHTPLLHSDNYYDPQPPPSYHAIPVGYQSYPYAVEGVPVREPPLPCCGIGIGWVLFLSGFFLSAIPWYVGAFILVFVALDNREKPGLVACTVAAVLAAMPIIFKLFKDGHLW